MGHPEQLPHWLSPDATLPLDSTPALLGNTMPA